MAATRLLAQETRFKVLPFQQQDFLDGSTWPTSMGKPRLRSALVYICKTNPGAGSTCLILVGPSKWYKPMTSQARVSQRSITFIIRYYAWCSEGGRTFSQAGWRHRLQMTHLQLHVDHLMTGWWGCVGTFRGTGVAGIWHASDGGALKGGETCFGGR